MFRLLVQLDETFEREKFVAQIAFEGFAKMSSRVLFQLEFEGAAPGAALVGASVGSVPRVRRLVSSPRGSLLKRLVAVKALISVREHE